MNYSRNNPSARHNELLVQYRIMHDEKKFSGGIGCYRHRHELRQLIRDTNAKTVLDFGCGAGRQFQDADPQALFSKLGIFCTSWKEALGVEIIAGYDPAVQQYSNPPKGKFDIVFSTDVLEHCSEEDLSWIVGDIFSYALKAVFLTVAIVPAKKNLPNGENAHVTLKPREWWLELIESVACRYPNTIYHVEFEDGMGEK